MFRLRVSLQINLHHKVAHLIQVLMLQDKVVITIKGLLRQVLLLLQINRVSQLLYLIFLVLFRIWISKKNHQCWILHVFKCWVYISKSCKLRTSTSYIISLLRPNVFQPNSGGSEREDLANFWSVISTLHKQKHDGLSLKAQIWIALIFC